MSNIFVKDSNFDNDKLKIVFGTASSIETIYKIECNYENGQILLLIKTSIFPWRREQNYIEVACKNNNYILWKTKYSESNKFVFNKKEFIGNKENVAEEGS